MNEELRAWMRRLELALARPDMLVIDRAAVLDECASTQDEAHHLAEGTPGLVVVAGRQTAGRGRLGRRWDDDRGRGVAMTFALDGAGFEPGELALIAGLTACFTAEAALELERPTAGLAQGLLGALINPVGAVAGVLGGVRLGLRWPNDVVARRTAGAAALKLAGCLVEVRDGLALVGIGVNVSQDAGDFPPGLSGQAASLSMLGSSWDRGDVIERLVVELDRCVQLPVEQAVPHWIRRETLAGTVQVFEHDGRRYTGVVETIDPLGSLRLRTDTGPVDLPALTTSLVQDPGTAAG